MGTHATRSRNIRDQMNLPEINIETIAAIKTKARKLTVKYSVDSDMEILIPTAGKEDALIKAMAKAMTAEIYEEMLFMVSLREAGIFVIQ